MGLKCFHWFLDSFSQISIIGLESFLLGFHSSFPLRFFFNRQFPHSEKLMSKEENNYNNMMFIAKATKVKITEQQSSKTSSCSV